MRDIGVTGVQTCALPIYLTGTAVQRLGDRLARLLDDPARVPARRVQGARGAHLEQVRRRSEERRAGKERRSRWSPYHYEKKSPTFTSLSSTSWRGGRRWT